MQQDDEQRSVCTYVKAEDWKMSSKGLKREQFMQLDIDINRVVFEHHWLFSKEDMVCADFPTFFFHRMRFYTSYLEGIK